MQIVRTPPQKLELQLESFADALNKSTDIVSVFSSFSSF